MKRYCSRCKKFTTSFECELHERTYYDPYSNDVFEIRKSGYVCKKCGQEHFYDNSYKRGEDE